MQGHHFICYSPADGLDFALRLYNALVAGPPPLGVWMDKHDLRPGGDWRHEIVEALGSCTSLLFIITEDSVAPHSVCEEEWSRALRYKKPIVPLLLQANVKLPFGLANRQFIDFSGNFAQGLAKLRDHLHWLASPAGVLNQLTYELQDARRDLSRAGDEPQKRERAEKDIADLEKRVAEQRRVVEDPEGAARKVQQRIESGLERERKPDRRPTGEQRIRFINQPPGVAPDYFQDRHVETKILVNFLKDDSRRMMTVIARGGMGKTAVVCRLLKAIENGYLPDDGAEMVVDGIVYLSETGSRRVNFANLFEDLCKLVPDSDASSLREMYKQGQLSVAFKMRALLQRGFSTGRVVVLLDNFEDVLDPETRNIKDTELDEALRTLLAAPHHGVKVIITTRLPLQDLALVEPGRQGRVEIDKGLQYPYAEEVLRAMDADGTLGLKSASDQLLAQARDRTLGHPKALEALAAILASDRNTSLEELLAETQKLPGNVTEALVGEAFNRLDFLAQFVLKALAIYACPVTPAAVDYLLQPYLPGVDAAVTLGRLVNMNFARKEGGKYYLHPVDRAYALSRLPPGKPQDRATIATRIGDEGARRQVKGKACIVLSLAPPFTQYALRNRGANYFRKARLPRREWKTLADLAPQLAEFELRLAGEDYDTAAVVLRDIAFEYLYLWGHFRLMIELHERLLPRVRDPWRGDALLMLGVAKSRIGQYAEAIAYHEKALALCRAVNDRSSERCNLVNLGNCYADLGQTARAIEIVELALTIARSTRSRAGEATSLCVLGTFYKDLGKTTRAVDYLQKSLTISRELGDFHVQSVALENLASCFVAVGQPERAIDLSEQALAIVRTAGNRYVEGFCLKHISKALILDHKYDRAVEVATAAAAIAEDIGSSDLGIQSYECQALALFYLGDLGGARAAIERARQFETPLHTARVLSLLGLIAMHQSEPAVARQAFSDAVQCADALIQGCAENCPVLEAKALALCGLAICADSSSFPEDEAQNLIVAAVATYRAARKISLDAGYLILHVRLLDALAQCDPDRRLQPAQRAARGESH